jgi:hypothetical protein
MTLQDASSRPVITARRTQELAALIARRRALAGGAPAPLRVVRRAADRPGTQAQTVPASPDQLR